MPHAPRPSTDVPAVPVRLELLAFRLADGTWLVTPADTRHHVVSALPFAPGFPIAAPVEVTGEVGAISFPAGTAGLLPSVAGTPTRPAKRTGKGPGKRVAATAAPATDGPTLAHQRRVCEREGYARAARVLGISPGTLRARGDRDGWTVPDGRALRTRPLEAPAPPAPPPAPDLAATEAPRRPRSQVKVVRVHTCPHCKASTDEDPCHRCKQPWGER